MSIETLKSRTGVTLPRRVLPDLSALATQAVAPSTPSPDPRNKVHYDLKADGTPDFKTVDVATLPDEIKPYWEDFQRARAMEKAAREAMEQAYLAVTDLVADQTIIFAWRYGFSRAIVPAAIARTQGKGKVAWGK